MRLWFPKPLGDEVIANLRARLPGHEISKEFHADAEILIEGRPTREQLQAASRLRSVIIPFAGVSPQLADLMREFPHISLHNLHHNAPDTAETALALLLACAKRTVEMDQGLRNDDWSLRYEPEGTLLLGGKTAVILGFGEIGRRLGRILEAMEMTVIPVRRSGPPLAEVLPKAQVLVVTAPLTPETRGMIGAREIARMPDEAILVNVARAQIVDEEALYRALESGKLHSAGSDVWYRYPAEEGTAVPTYFVAPPSAKNTPPGNFPFGKLPNMVFSPHRGGATRDTESRRADRLIEMVRAGESGEMPNRIDLDRGY